MAYWDLPAEYHFQLHLHGVQEPLTQGKRSAILAAHMKIWSCWPQVLRMWSCLPQMNSLGEESPQGAAGAAIPVTQMVGLGGLRQLWDCSGLVRQM